MLTLERETCSGVVEMCLVPCNRGMAIATWVFPEGSPVRVFIGMASSTCRVDGFVVAISVAFTAVDLTVPTFQGKAAHGVVIKSHILGFETLRLVTSIAIVSRELTAVSVLVTTITTLTGWIPFFPRVTIQTKRFVMFTRQRPPCALMIKIDTTTKALRNVTIVTP